MNLPLQLPQEFYPGQKVIRSNVDGLIAHPSISRCEKPGFIPFADRRRTLARKEAVARVQDEELFPPLFEILDNGGPPGHSPHSPLPSGRARVNHPEGIIGIEERQFARFTVLAKKQEAEHQD